MKEKMPPNEDIIFAQQINKVMSAGACPENAARRHVSAASVIAWLLLAQAGMSLWLLGLLGYL